MKTKLILVIYVLFLEKTSRASQICSLNTYLPNEEDNFCKETYLKDNMCKDCHETCNGPNINNCLTCETQSAIRKIFNKNQVSYSTIGLQATTTSELGSRITFDGTSRNLKYFTRGRRALRQWPMGRRRHWPSTYAENIRGRHRRDPRYPTAHRDSNAFYQISPHRVAVQWTRPGMVFDLSGSKIILPDTIV
jgi:hypothetical protein